MGTVHRVLNERGCHRRNVRDYHVVRRVDVPDVIERPRAIVSVQARGRTRGVGK